MVGNRGIRIIIKDKKESYIINEKGGAKFEHFLFFPGLIDVENVNSC